MERKVERGGAPGLTELVNPATLLRAGWSGREADNGEGTLIGDDAEEIGLNGLRSENCADALAIVAHVEHH
jgi:hypothetical protein